MEASESMADIVIGHTSDRSARVWIRGDSRILLVKYPLIPRATDFRSRRSPVPNTDYTATVELDHLEPGVDYAVDGKEFAPSEFHACGRLCTMRQSDDDTYAFSFVIFSCNLSVVSINNFLSFLAASAGISLARSSLTLPFHRWRRPRLDWPKRLIQPLITR